LPHGLRDEEEVVPLGEGHDIVNDGTRRRVAQRLSVDLLEEAAVDALRYDDEGEERLVFVAATRLQGLLDGHDLLGLDGGDLAFANAVAVDDYPFGKLAVVGLRVPEA
jgi:hypothetical protein